LRPLRYCCLRSLGHCVIHLQKVRWFRCPLLRSQFLDENPKNLSCPPCFFAAEPPPHVFFVLGRAGGLTFPWCQCTKADAKRGVRYQIQPLFLFERPFYCGIFGPSYGGRKLTSLVFLFGGPWFFTSFSPLCWSFPPPPFFSKNRNPRRFFYVAFNSYTTPLPPSSSIVPRFSRPFFSFFFPTCWLLPDRSA